MSADNWRQCPRCLANHKEQIAAELQEANQAYGKVPADEYRAKLDKAKANSEVELEDTLREDYQIGVDEDGQFAVGYRASCEQCNFVFRFDHTQSAMGQSKPVKGRT